MATHETPRGTPEPTYVDSPDYMSTPGSLTEVDDTDLEIMEVTEKTDSHAKHPGQKQWVSINHLAKQNARSINGGVLPPSPAFYTSNFPNKDTWSTENLPEILFQLEVRPNPHKDDLVTTFTRDDGLELRKFEILPDYVSVDVEGWLVHAWVCTDNRIANSDITRRMVADDDYYGHQVKVPIPNTLANRIMRGCKKILGSSMKLRGDSEVKPRLTVESVEQLSYENLWTNSVLSRSPEFPNRLVRKKFVKKGEGVTRQYMAVDLEVTIENLEETTFAVDHFCVEQFNPLLKTQLEIALEPAIMTLWDLQKKAEIHGLLHWKYLSKGCLPTEWFDRTKHKAPENHRFDGGCEDCSWTPFYDLPAPEAPRFSFMYLRQNYGIRELSFDSQHAFIEDTVNLTAQAPLRQSPKRRRGVEASDTVATGSPTKKVRSIARITKNMDTPQLATVAPAAAMPARLTGGPQSGEPIDLARDEQQFQIYDDLSEADIHESVETDDLDNDDDDENIFEVSPDDLFGTMPNHNKNYQVEWSTDTDFAPGSDEGSDTGTVINFNNESSPGKSYTRHDMQHHRTGNFSMQSYPYPGSDEYVIIPSIERPGDYSTETDVVKAGFQFDGFQPYGVVGDGHFHDGGLEDFDPRMALPTTLVEDPFSSSGLPTFNPLTGPNPFKQHFGNLSFEYSELDRAAVTEQSMTRVQQQSAALHSVIEFGPALAMSRSVPTDWEQLNLDADTFRGPPATLPGSSTIFDSFDSDTTLVPREMHTPENDNLTVDSSALAFTDEANRFWDLGAPLNRSSPLQSYGFEDGAAVEMFPASPVKRPMGVKGRRVFTLRDDEDFEGNV